jgi:ABC-type uncharacterized transport system substrate-binding protein
MKRRGFITLLGGAAAAWPLAVHAQQPAMPVVGLLSGAPIEDRDLAVFRRSFAETGHVDGRNITVEYRSAEGLYDRLPTLAAELVRRKVAVILAFGGTVTPVAAKAATATIPIVFAIGGDPVKVGLVSSLNRPGGNVTGVSFLANALGSKRIELLRELVPKATLLGFLANPLNANLASETEDMQAAARAREQQISIQHATSEADIDLAFANLGRHRVDTLVVAADAYFFNRRYQVSALAARHAIPAIYSVREHAMAGGLMSYGTSRADAYHQAGVYVGRILKGESAADLPVMQSTKFELVINIQIAKTLGLVVSPKLLALADEVIE